MPTEVSHPRLAPTAERRLSHHITPMRTRGVGPIAKKNPAPRLAPLTEDLSATLKAHHAPMAKRGYPVTVRITPYTMRYMFNDALRLAHVDKITRKATAEELQP